MLYKISGYLIAVPFLLFFISAQPVRPVRADRSNKDSLKAAAIVDRVNEDSIRYFLKRIYGQRNVFTKGAIEHANECKQFFSQTFSRYHLTAAVETISKGNGYAFQNITGALPGKKAGVLVIGAHSDTVDGSPGADDNGTGLAVMLEVARVLNGYALEKGVVLAAFDQEEDKMQGSFYFVHHYPNPANIIGLINMDMIGYTSDKPGSQQIPEGFDSMFPDAGKQVRKNGARGNFLVCIANKESAFLEKAFTRDAGEYVPELHRISLIVAGKGEDMPDSRRSDHANFWDSHIPALYLGDGANTRNPYYHTPKDTPDKVNYRQVTLVARAVLSLIADVCHPVAKAD
jgi:Peptidase family M28